VEGDQAFAGTEPWVTVNRTMGDGEPNHG
jgi:hypothetical protein